jgi:sarcosine oxidase subunit beta
MGMGGPDEPSFDTRVDESFVGEELLPVALEVFPPLAGAGIRSTWSGLYEMTPDRHPIVGPTTVSGLWVAAGFSGHGFQHGPIVGKLVAEMVSEGAARTVDVSDLRYQRFGAGTHTAERHVV